MRDPSHSPPPPPSRTNTKGVARKGRYGSFLLGELDLLHDIVSTLHKGLRIPITVKIRILPTLEETLKLVETLVSAGAQLLTVHGRTKEMNKTKVGVTNWDWIAKIREQIGGRIPLFANGSIASYEDVQRCLSVTGADGVMTSEAILESPALFSGGRDPVTQRELEQLELAREYLDICRTQPPPTCSFARAHLFKLLYMALAAHTDLRAELNEAREIDTLVGIVEALGERTAHLSREEKVEQGLLLVDGRVGVDTWYGRHQQKVPAEAGEVEVVGAGAGGLVKSGCDSEAMDDGSMGSMFGGGEAAGADY